MRTSLKLAVIAAAFATSIATSPAVAGIGEWAVADVVRARVVASFDEDGHPVAAIEIRLNPGWKAYWRTPGEGGLPTVFDFSLSRNLASADANYPPPRRYNDGYTTTNVYEGRVLFPIELSSALSSVSMAIVVQIDMGVCEQVCIPLQLETSVELPVGAEDAAARSIIDEAIAILPNVPEPGVFEVTGVALVVDDSETALFEATAIVPQAFGSDLFIEGPVGWYPTAPQQIGRTGNTLTFAFAFERSGEAAPLEGSELTFTLVSSGAAIEQRIMLP